MNDGRILDLRNVGKKKVFYYVFWIDIKKYETDKTIYTHQLYISMSIKIDNNNILESVTRDLFAGIDKSLMNPVTEDTIHIKNLLDKHPGKNKYLVTNFKLIND